MVDENKQWFENLNAQQVTLVRDHMQKLLDMGVPIDKFTSGQIIKRMDQNVNISDRKYLVDSIDTHHESDDPVDWTRWEAKTNCTRGDAEVISLAWMLWNTMRADCYNIEKKRLCVHLGLTRKEYDDMKTESGNIHRFNGNEYDIMKLDRKLWSRVTHIMKEHLSIEDFITSMLRILPSVDGKARWDYKQAIIGVSNDYRGEGPEDDLGEKIREHVE